jgi:hypothetical protein
VSKKRTGLFVAAGCGLLLCIPLCAGVIGGGGLLWFSMADSEMASFELPSEFDALMDEPFEAVPVDVEDMDDEGEIADAQDDEDLELDEELDDEDLEADEGLDSGLDEEVDELDEDALVELDEVDDEDVAEARIIEDEGEVTVTNTRPAATPKKNPGTKPRDQPKRAEPAPAPAPQPEPEPFDDEEDFDDIAAEIAALDSLDDMDEPSEGSNSGPSDKPGTIKVSGDYDRASVIGSDGVYRSPGKFDPGTYRLEITLDDGTVVNKTIKLKGGQTVKLKCDVDAGTCTR